MAMAVSALSLTGCDDDSTSASKAPEIESITASETTTTMGQTIQLIVVATDKNDAALNFQWSATGGTFSATDDDTVSWTAPEEETIFTLTVKVDNDVEITTGTIDIGVGVYVPTVQPYYVGAEACSGCHAATYADWMGTAHSDAYDRKLEELAAYCMPCHTVGYDDTVDNGGWDENPVSELTNIQCESCHGPASAHLASTDKINDPQISASLNEDACAPCHVSSRTSFWTDWESHLHNVGTHVGENGSYGGRSGCSRCHGGNGYIQYIADGTSPAYDFATEEVVTVNCVTCHDPHDATNHYQLRAGDATMPDGDVVTVGGAGLTCQNCHTGRRDATDIEEQLSLGDSHGGPHHGPNTAILHGINIADEVAPAGFVWANSMHASIEGSCANCHMHGEGVQPPATNGFSSHKFEPSVESCEPCHGVIADFDDILAHNDYDGDGAVEGVQSEVSGLMADLLDAFISIAGLDTVGYDGDDDLDIIATAAFDTNGAPAFAGLAGGLTERDVRAAAYNLLVVSYDHSHGVHNAAFAIQLLQQSYQHIGGTLTGKELIPGGF